MQHKSVIRNRELWFPLPSCFRRMGFELVKHGVQWSTAIQRFSSVQKTSRVSGTQGIPYNGYKTT